MIRSMVKVTFLSLSLLAAVACNKEGGSNKQKGPKLVPTTATPLILMQTIGGSWVSDCSEVDADDVIKSERVTIKIDDKQVEATYQAFSKEGCEEALEDVFVVCSAKHQEHSMTSVKIRSQNPEVPAEITYNEATGLKVKFDSLEVVSIGERVTNGEEQCEQLISKEGEVYVNQANYLLRSNEFDGTVYIMNDLFKYWKQ